MGFLKRCLVSQLLVILVFVGTTAVCQAAEMSVDVGIEFTDIEPEPKEKDKLEPTAKPPIKKVVQLPQTGEKKSQGFTVIGTLIMTSAGLYIYKKKSGVTKE